MTPSNPPRAVVRNDRSMVVFREDGEQIDLPEWVASHFGLNAEPSEEQAQAAVRAMTPSNPASGTNEARLQEALRDEQNYASALSDALLSIGHHPFGKHEAPNQYDGDSPRACSFPGCLAALATERAIGAALDVPTRHDWRLVLWQGHGHEGLYGDDGEMQCNRYPPADFKRDHIDSLLAHIDWSTQLPGLASETPRPGEPTDG